MKIFSIDPKDVLFDEDGIFGPIDQVSARIAESVNDKAGKEVISGGSPTKMLQEYTYAEFARMLAYNNIKADFAREMPVLKPAVPMYVAEHFEIADVSVNLIGEGIKDHHEGVVLDLIRATNLRNIAIRFLFASEN